MQEEAGDSAIFERTRGIDTESPKSGFNLTKVHIFLYSFFREAALNSFTVIDHAGGANYGNRLA